MVKYIYGSFFYVYQVPLTMVTVCIERRINPFRTPVPFWDISLGFRVACRRIGTAALKGLFKESIDARDSSRGALLGEGEKKWSTHGRIRTTNIYKYI